MGNYNEDYFKSFAIKRFNDLTERKRKEDKSYDDYMTEKTFNEKLGRLMRK